MHDHVTCAVCGVKGKGLISHIRVHGLTTSQYREKFPKSPLDCLATQQKRRARRPNLRLMGAHQGEKPTRHWSVAKLLVEGKTAAEIGSSIGRTPHIVKKIGRRLHLSSRPSRYDLGVRVTRGHLADLQKATGLDGPSFASRFGIPVWLTHGKAGQARKLLSPPHAAATIAARDKIISEVYRLSRNKGRGKWTGSSPKVLSSLVPHFPKVATAIRDLLAESKARRGGEWQDWVCEHTRTGERSAYLSVLPLAIELSPWIEPRLNELEKRRDLWRLAMEILASRFGVSSFVATEKRHPLQPREMERLILRLDPDRGSMPRDGLAAPPKKLNGVGAPRVTKVDYHEAKALRDATPQPSWKDIAKKLDYDNYAKGGKSRKRAADRIRVNVERLDSHLDIPPILGGDK